MFVISLNKLVIFYILKNLNINATGVW